VGASDVEYLTLKHKKLNGNMDQAVFLGYTIRKPKLSNGDIVQVVCMAFIFRIDFLLTTAST